MYVVFAEDFEATPAAVVANTVQTLDQALARICNHCGLAYRFVPEDDGWCLEMTDVVRPERTANSIHTPYKRPQDAHADLMEQAVDGRIRGHMALHVDVFAHARNAAHVA
jgi:hypothetical protein